MPCGNLKDARVHQPDRIRALIHNAYRKKLSETALKILPPRRRNTPEYLEQLRVHLPNRTQTNTKVIDLNYSKNRSTGHNGAMIQDGLAASFKILSARLLSAKGPTR